MELGSGTGIDRSAAPHVLVHMLRALAVAVVLSGTTAYAADSTDARAYQAHVKALRARLAAKLPGKAFAIVVEPPFVVIGDEPPDRVRKRAVHTVRWAVARLKAEYFSADPPH